MERAVAAKKREKPLPIKKASSAKRSDSLRQRTYEQLKDLIVSGSLGPAEKLAESRLAVMLGVSRTPLREALMKLEEEGLVVSERNIGYKVANLDIKAVYDLLVVREALDACAAEICATMASDADRKRIELLLGEMAKLQKAKRSMPADTARELELGIYIHQVIAEATGNEALIKLTGQIYQQLRLALWLEVLWIDLKDSALSEHEAIVQAILARDSIAAGEAARRHVRSSIDNMSKVKEIYAFRGLRKLR
jgi:DNA-binding GntR family transcriptional regulator